MSRGAQADLVDRLRPHIAEWPVAKRAGSGLELLGMGDEGSALRRRHARTVLAAEHVLELAASAGPAMLMKGLEVAHLYPNLLDRPFRDVDVLLRKPGPLWQQFVDLGYTQRSGRRIDIDHHHLPSLRAPFGAIGIEVHVRPNTPAWATLPIDLLFETAQPSRTGIEGLTRPRDDLHALLMAMHGWKGGFTRLRDLFDALLLASVSDVPVEHTADQLGLARFWEWTKRFADLELFGVGSRSTRQAARWLLPRHDGLSDRKRVRLLSPYLVANPIRVTRGHLAEYRLGRAARHPTGVTSSQ